MFEIPGWDEFVARCEGVVDKWEDKKKKPYKKRTHLEVPLKVDEEV